MKVVFLKTFHGNFIYSHSFCQKSDERKSLKKYFLYSALMSGLGLESRLHVYLLDYGDFIFILRKYCPSKIEGNPQRTESLKGHLNMESLLQVEVAVV